MQKTVKDSMFLGWVSESIRIVIWSNSQFKFCTRNFAKSEFVVNVEKLNLADTGSYDWDSNSLRFENISNTETESISHS